MKNFQTILVILCTFIIYSTAQDVSAEAAKKCQPAVGQYLNQKIMQTITKNPVKAMDKFNLTVVYNEKFAKVSASIVKDINKATIGECDNAYENHRDFRLFACEYNTIMPDLLEAIKCLECIIKEAGCAADLCYWAKCLIDAIHASSTIADAENPLREYKCYKDGLKWEQPWL